jgi:hypothetical protein
MGGVGAAVAGRVGVGSEPITVGLTRFMNLSPRVPFERDRFDDMIDLVGLEVLVVRP